MKQIVCILIMLGVCMQSRIVAQSAEAYQLSTHILDINQGKPAKDVSIILYKLDSETAQFKKLDSGKTDQNGRIPNFLSLSQNNEGVYKLRFETLPYFEEQSLESIYPYIEIIFQIKGKEHYHIPITLSANGYSTYKGN